MNNSRPSSVEKEKKRVYLDFYHLDEAPFSVTPDPEFLFYSVTHRNAIEKLLYGINSRMGFLLLVGEVGTGKTTICRSLLDQLTDKAFTVYIINPSLSGTELISSILDDLGITYPKDATKKDLIDILNNFLLSMDEQQPVVVIIDDAQTMHTDALEDMRLLSNLETDKDKLLQILLVGQPELLVQLTQPEMRQLKQRVALTCRLDFLSRNEVEGYISRRLFISGDKGHIRFKSDALRIIFSISKGIPRLINRICDYALTAAYVSDTHEISQEHVKKAVLELKDLEETGNPSKAVRSHMRKWLRMAALISLACAGIAWGLWYFKPALLSPSSRIKPSPKQASAPIEESAIQQQALQEQVVPEPSISQPAPEPSSPAVSSSAAEVPEAAEDVYIIRVASFKTLQRVEKAAAQLRKKGIQSYWELVDTGKKGQWYGLYTGRFKTLNEAKGFRTANDLPDAIIEHRYGERP